MKACFLVSYGEVGSLQYGEFPEPVLTRESVYPLEKSSEAFDKAQFGNPRGKVIIKVNE